MNLCCMLHAARKHVVKHVVGDIAWSHRLVTSIISKLGVTKTSDTSLQLQGEEVHYRPGGLLGMLFADVFVTQAQPPAS